MKGGIILRDKPTNLFDLLMNCEYNTIYYPHVLRARLTDPTKSPYLSLNLNTLLEPVMEFIIKIYDYHIDSKANVIRDLNNEARIQQDIYVKSLTDREYPSPFEPICPAVIGTIDLTNEQTELFLTKYHISNGYYRDHINEKANNGICMLIMEHMGDYHTLYDILRNEDLSEQQVHMINYTYKRILDIGYYHDDCHNKNILIDLKYPYFTSNKNDKRYLGRVIIIDFDTVLPATEEYRMEKPRYSLDEVGYIPEDIHTFCIYKRRFRDIPTSLDKFNDLNTRHTNVIREKVIPTVINAYNRYKIGYKLPLDLDTDHPDFIYRLQDILLHRIVYGGKHKQPSIKTKHKRKQISKKRRILLS